MKKYFLPILILILVSTQLTCSQSLTKKYFKKSSWFTNNKDSLFHKTDTIRFIKNSNPIEYLENIYEEGEYFDDSECVIFSFKENNHLDFFTKNFHEYELSFKKYDFNKKDSILKIGIRFKEEVLLNLKVISVKKLKYKKGEKEFETTEIIVVKK